VQQTNNKKLLLTANNGLNPTFRMGKVWQLPNHTKCYTEVTEDLTFRLGLISLMVWTGEHILVPQKGRNFSTSQMVISHQVRFYSMDLLSHQKGFCSMGLNTEKLITTAKNF
jgi:hypothetical protein